jgi:hypothetical protein
MNVDHDGGELPMALNATDRLDLIKLFLRVAGTGRASEAARGRGEEIKIWRSANILIDKHGTDALTTAEQRAAEMINRGDAEGLGVGSGSWPRSTNCC